MSVYLTGCFDIHDLETYKKYIAESHPIMDRFKAKVLAAGQTAVTFEGQPSQVVVVVEFDNQEQAEAYYYSPEYQAAAKTRQMASTGWLAILPGR